MKKKIFAALLVAAMSVTMLAGCGGSKSGSTTSDGKLIINVYAFTDEVPNMIKAQFGDKYEIKDTIVPTTDGAYQPALDAALQGGGEDAPDIYCAEAAFVLKYTQGDAKDFAATYKDLGIDIDKEIADSQIAQYSVDIGSRDGEVVGLGYQATGGAFIYRRSIAIDTWGTDDPAVVGEKIGAGSGNWDAFMAAAEELKAKGYGIVSGDGDIWHAIENSSEKGWIVDGKLYIDPKREAFFDYSKQLKDNGYHHDTQDWQEGWFADMKKDGGVLGFYGPAWLINYTLGQNCGEGDDSSAGDWAVCAPNVGFFWGGTWVLANAAVVGTDKQEAVAEIIRWITLDATQDGLQYKWANACLYPTSSTKDCVASGAVMEISNGEIDFLGGQNMFEAFVPANTYANGKNLTQYDETINQYWRDAVRTYTSGEKSKEEAIETFKTNVKENLDVQVD